MACALSLGLSLSRGASAAEAEDIHVERTPEAQDCPDAERLLQRLQLMTALDAVQLLEGVRVRVAFDRDLQGVYNAHVVVAGARSGERAISDRSANCRALEQAVGIAISMLVEDGRATEGEAVSKPTASEPAVAPVTDAESKLQLKSKAAAEIRPLTTAAGEGLSSRTAPGPAFRAEIGGGFGWGLAPGTHAQASGMFGVQLSDFALELGARSVLPVRRSFEMGSVATALTFGSVRGCYSLLRAQVFRIEPCAEFGVGQRTSAGRGFTEPLRSRLLWAGGSLSLALDAELGYHVRLGVDGALWAPLQRQRLVVGNLGAAWQSPPVAATVSIRAALLL